jgi:uncharacterized membrane protein YukC
MLKRGNQTIWKWIAYGFCCFALVIIFSAYYAPDMMIAVTNQVWALCGW